MKSLLCIFFVSLTLNIFSQNTGTFTDNRDGQRYKRIKNGSQIWMAENLKYKARGSGYYDLNLYGRLYDFKTALNICPPGWHLPSDSEWKILERTLGMDERTINAENRDHYSGEAGLKLKSKSGWEFYMQNGNGIDLYGFNAPPGGYYQKYNKKFMYYGSGITFWTSTAVDSENAIVRELGSHFNGIGRSEYNKVHGGYIRCIKK